MAFRKKIVIITDDCSLNLNNYIIEILHPKSQTYNDGITPTNDWITLKLPFCKEIMLNPWMYKTLISSYGFLEFRINVIGDGRLTRYARKILDKGNYPYTYYKDNQKYSIFQSFEFVLVSLREKLRLLGLMLLP